MTKRPLMLAALVGASALAAATGSAQQFIKHAAKPVVAPAAAATDAGAAQPELNLAVDAGAAEGEKVGKHVGRRANLVAPVADAGAVSAEPSAPPDTTAATAPVTPTTTAAPAGAKAGKAAKPAKPAAKP